MTDCLLLVHESGEFGKKWKSEGYGVKLRTKKYLLLKIASVVYRCELIAVKIFCDLLVLINFKGESLQAFARAPIN